MFGDMGAMVMVLVGLVSMMAVTQAASSGTCYACTYIEGHKSAGCEDTFDPTRVAKKTCTNNKCMKVMYSDPTKGVVRDCGSRLCSKDGTVADYDYGGYKGKVYCCIGDICNGSVPSGGATAWPLLSAAVLLLWNRV